MVNIQSYRCLVLATFPPGTMPWDYVKPLAVRVSHWEEKDGIDPRFSPRAARRFGLVRRGA